MGGHGGLNILPQKRWNVYNRDNRLKVAQDEAKAREEEEEAKQRHIQAEQAFRHQALLRKLDGHTDHTAVAETSSAAAVVQPVQILEHINFWKDDETKAEHPDVLKEKKDEIRRRGNKETYTSDATFDERFKLGYGLGGAKPWYAQLSQPVASQQLQQQNLGQPSSLISNPPSATPQLITAQKSKKRKRRSAHADASAPTSSTSSSDSSDSSAESSDSSGHKRKRRRKSAKTLHRSSKEKTAKSKKHRHKERHKSQHPTSHATAALGKDIAQLRAERLARERSEKDKARLALIGALDGQGTVGAGAGYNSAFGYAAAMKKPRA